MATFGIGGGGGKAPSFTANNRYNLAKPHEIEGDPTAEKMAQINEMLQELYMAQQLSINSLIDGGILDQESGESSSGGSGDVTGPSSATSGNVAQFDGATGKVLSDSGISSSFIQGLSAGQLTILEFTLTEAQLEGMPVTPVQLVSAPGALKQIIPVSLALRITVGTAYGNGPSLQLNYTGVSGTDILPAAGLLTTTTGTKHSQATGKGSATTFNSASDVSNTALEASLSAALTGAGSVSLIGRLMYWVADFN